MLLLVFTFLVEGADAQPLSTILISAQNVCGCPDKQPEEYNCQIQKERLDNCNSTFIMEGEYCAFTCGQCVCYNNCICTDYSPNYKYTCQELSEFGKCGEPWMLSGEYCKLSCGRCTSDCEQVHQKQMIIDEIPIPYIQVYPSQLGPQQELEQEEEEQYYESDYVEESGEIEVVDLVLMSQASTATLPHVTLPPESMISLSQSLGLQPSEEPACEKDLQKVLLQFEELQYMGEQIEDNPMLKLMEIQSEQQPMTWFVPTWQSIVSLYQTLANVSAPLAETTFANQELLWQLFSGHIVGGSYSYEDLLNAPVLQTVKDQQNITVVYLPETGQIAVMGYLTEAYVINQELRTCTSIIYALDGVILHPDSIIAKYLVPSASIPITTPSPQQQQQQPSFDTNCSSPLQLINSEPRFGLVTQLIEKAGIEAELSAMETNLTIFLPLDPDIDKSEEDQGLLSLQPEKIKQLLLFHIVPNFLRDLSGLEDGKVQSHTLVVGSYLNLKAEGGERVLQANGQSAKIVQEGFTQSCGVVIHIIDGFLDPSIISSSTDTIPQYRAATNTTRPLPQPPLSCERSAWDLITSQDAFKILMDLQVQYSREIDQRLLDPQTTLTLFLPDAQSQEYMVSISKLLDSPLESTIQIVYDFVLYHIVVGVQIPDLSSSNLDVQQAEILNFGRKQYSTMASELPVYVEFVKDEDKDGAWGMAVQGIGSTASVVSARSKCGESGVQVFYLQGQLLPFSNVNMGIQNLPTENEAALDSQVPCSSDGSLLEFIKDTPQISRLVSMLGDNLQIFISSQGSRRATYFLPTNDAIDTLLKKEGVLDRFESEANLGPLIVQYHTIEDQLLDSQQIIQMANRRTQRYTTKFNGMPLAIQKLFGTLVLIGEVGLARLTFLQPFYSCSSVVHLIDTVLLPFLVTNITDSDPEEVVITPSQVPPVSPQGFEASLVVDYLEEDVENLPAEFVQPVAITSNLGEGESLYDTQFVVVEPLIFSSPPFQMQQTVYPGSMFSAPSQDLTSTTQIQPVRPGCESSFSSYVAARLQLAYAYLREAGYGSYLDKLNADFTLFAPVTEAFERKLPGYDISLTEMRNDPSMHDQFVKIMSYHVVNFPVSGNIQLGSRGIFATEAFDEGGYRLQVRMRKVMEQFALRETTIIEGPINNASVSGSVLRICDAYIYPIDQVLSIPPDEQQPPLIIPIRVPDQNQPKPNIQFSTLIPTATEVTYCMDPLHQIQNQNDLENFNQLLHYSNISSVLDSIENITIFAPIDSGLIQILQQLQFTQLNLIPPEITQNWIAYHIVQGVYPRESLEQEQELQTWVVDSSREHLNLTINLDKDRSDKVYIVGNRSTAEILRFDIEACNSVIHIINAPLMP